MKSCIFCVQKHLGLADVYLQESRAGYRGRYTKVLGQLAAAEEESCADFPDLAKEIRAVRKCLEQDRKNSAISLEGLLVGVESLADYGRIVTILRVFWSVSGPRSPTALVVGRRRSSYRRRSSGIPDHDRGRNLSPTS